MLYKVSCAIPLNATYKNHYPFLSSMCGIIGYIGAKQVQDLLVQGLEHLEYRGYDSSGIAVVDQSKNLNVQKVMGRVKNLKETMQQVQGTMGMGHTRWATHGKPSDENAHPHTDCESKLALIHNGIIENFLELKQQLLAKGHKFTSETDTEVIAHLIEEELKQQSQPDLHKALQATIKQLVGAYALCIVHKDFDYLVVARNGSPLVLGLGEGENFFGSDVTAFIDHTKKAVYLNDFETAIIRKEKVQLFDKQEQEIQREPTVIDWDREQAQKGGYQHFMLKEIFEQPKVVEETLQVEIPQELVEKVKSVKKIFVLACGTASYACLVGKYLLEKTAKIPVEWETGSEFRYKDPLIGKDDLLVVVSQSGETADTLAGVRIAQEKGATVLGIVNVVDSTIARESDHVIYTRAGPEIGVASTKAFMAQLTIFYKLAELLGGNKLGLEGIPDLVKKVLELSETIQAIAKKYFMVYNFFYIGRNLMYPLALEGANEFA